MHDVLPLLARAGSPGATTSYTENSTLEPVEPRRVLYSYYTAGSGGVGPTILETSLLLAGEPCVVYANGERVSGGSPLPWHLSGRLTAPWMVGPPVARYVAAYVGVLFVDDSEGSAAVCCPCA